MEYGIFTEHSFWGTARASPHGLPLGSLSSHFAKARESLSEQTRNVPRRKFVKLSFLNLLASEFAKAGHDFCLRDRCGTRCLAIQPPCVAESLASARGPAPCVVSSRFYESGVCPKDRSVLRSRTNYSNAIIAYRKAIWLKRCPLRQIIRDSDAQNSPWSYVQGSTFS